MYFNASERIARRSTKSRDKIEQLDEFLARPRIRRFSIYDLQALTGLESDDMSLLKEYVKERILREKVIYKCPVHDIELNKGHCIDCEKTYPLDDCPSKQVYERIVEPDRELVVDSQGVKTVVEKEKVNPWWKKWEAWSLIIGALGLLGLSYQIYQGERQNNPEITPTTNIEILATVQTPTTILVTETSVMIVTPTQLATSTPQPTEDINDVP